VLERGGRGGRDFEEGFCSLLRVKEILAFEGRHFLLLGGSVRTFVFLSGRKS